MKIHSDDGHFCKTSIPSKLGQFQFENVTEAQFESDCGSFKGLMELMSYENVEIPALLNVEKFEKMACKNPTDAAAISFQMYKAFNLENDRRNAPELETHMSQNTLATEVQCSAASQTSSIGGTNSTCETSPKQREGNFDTENTDVLITKFDEENQTRFSNIQNSKGDQPCQSLETMVNGMHLSPQNEKACNDDVKKNPASASNGLHESHHNGNAMCNGTKKASGMLIYSRDVGEHANIANDTDVQQIPRINGNHTPNFINKIDIHFNVNGVKDIPACNASNNLKITGTPQSDPQADMVIIFAYALFTGKNVQYYGTLGMEAKDPGYQAKNVKHLQFKLYLP